MHGEHFEKEFARVLNDLKQPFSKSNCERMPDFILYSDKGVTRFELKSTKLTISIKNIESILNKNKQQLNSCIGLGAFYLFDFYMYKTLVLYAPWIFIDDEPRIYTYENNKEKKQALKHIVKWNKNDVQ